MTPAVATPVYTGVNAVTTNEDNLSVHLSARLLMGIKCGVRVLAWRKEFLEWKSLTNSDSSSEHRS